MKKQTSIIVVLLVIFSVLLTACGAQATATPAPVADVISTNNVVAEGRLEPVQGTNLSFQARGIVEAILVKAGDSVRQGDILVRLANAGGAEAQLLVAQDDYDTLLRNESGSRAILWQAYMDAQIVRGKAEKKWDDLNVTDIEDRIDDDKATVEDRQQDVIDAQDEFDKYADLDKDNTKRKNAEDALEKAQEDLHLAQRNLEETIRERDSVRAAYDAALGLEAEARHQYEISLDGPNADQLSLSKANLDAAKDALSNYVLTAPFDGVVADVNVKVGEQMGAETRAVSLANFNSWFVETTDITELEVVKLKVGQAVTIVPDALLDLTLTGTITEISRAYIQQGGDILYTVRIAVNETDPRLMWGMTVEASFLEAQ
ncbi:MAG: HlyD family efflux transporter periplasmic adaptor subunit [Chloroflexi bacterium]|nr:HlyD family efflux transporter periplasmic adaptor subunit [Chloroflexota bacterium]